MLHLFNSDGGEALLSDARPNATKAELLGMLKMLVACRRSQAIDEPQDLQNLHFRVQARPPLASPAPAALGAASARILAASNSSCDNTPSARS